MPIDCRSLDGNCLAVRQPGSVWGRWRHYWDEMDLRTGWWTIPAERVKNKLTHAVPLPPLAVEIIQRQPRKGSYVFPSRLIEPKPIEGSTLSARFADLMRDLAIEGVRLHDLRHTVKTGLAQLGVPEGISDRVTNQVSGQRTRVGSRYDHHTYLAEKRRALELWAARLQEIVEGRKPAGLRWETWTGAQPTREPPVRDPALDAEYGPAMIVT